MVSFVDTHGGGRPKGPPTPEEIARTQAKAAIRAALFPLEDADEQWKKTSYPQQGSDEETSEYTITAAVAIARKIDDSVVKIDALVVKNIIREIIEEAMNNYGISFHHVGLTVSPPRDGTNWRTITLSLPVEVFEAPGGLRDKLANPEMLKQLHDGPQPGFGVRG